MKPDGQDLHCFQKRVYILKKGYLHGALIRSDMVDIVFTILPFPKRDGKNSTIVPHLHETFLNTVCLNKRSF